MDLRVFGGCLGAVLLLASAWPSAWADDKPYVIKDGKVDPGTYNGWRRYSESCMRCHGPDGAGSSYAPDLTTSLKTMSEDTFRDTVMGGRVNVGQAAENVMPSFANVEDVATYINDIYAYLKARSDGVLDRGRPEKFSDKAKANE